MDTGNVQGPVTTGTNPSRLVALGAIGKKKPSLKEAKRSAVTKIVKAAGGKGGCGKGKGGPGDLINRPTGSPTPLRSSPTALPPTPTVPPMRTAPVMGRTVVPPVMGRPTTMPNPQITRPAPLSSFTPKATQTTALPPVTGSAREPGMAKKYKNLSKPYGGKKK